MQNSLAQGLRSQEAPDICVLHPSGNLVKPMHHFSECF